MTDSSLRVLVVENDPAVRARISPLLSALPYDTEYLHSVEVLMKRLFHSKEPSLVIMDDATLLDSQEEITEIFEQSSPESRLIVISGKRVIAKDPISRHTLGIIDWHELGDLDNLLKSASDAVQKAVAEPTDDPKNEASLPEEDSEQEGGWQSFPDENDPEGRDATSEFAWLGELSAMLAHELSAPLDGSLRYLGLIKKHVDQPEKVLSFVKEMDDALGRMARLTRSMLAYSRTVHSPKPPRPLREMIESAEKQVRLNVPRQGLALAIDGEGNPEVPSELYQVFTNLIRNGFDAMPSGGTLTIQWEQKEARFDLTIQNEGPPISEEDKKNAFTPFYTTKSFGQGSGLGLPICRRLVQSLGGHIEFEDRADIISIHVWFPLAKS